MRRRLLTVFATTVLGVGLLSPGTADAAALSYVVNGHPISAAPNLRLVGDTCTGGGTQPTVTELERQGGTLGVGALGWSLNQASSEAGPAVTLQGDPTTISSARVDVYAPTGTSGHAYAWFPTSSTSYYVGWRSFSVPAGQWIQNDLTNVGYYWQYYSNGQFVSETESAWTIQDWAAGEGATVAEIGVLLGCGGEQFYVDDMVVANAAGSVTYDLEPKAVAPTPTPTPTAAPVHSVAHLEWSTDGRTVRDGSEVVIRYGQQLWMLGHGHLHSDAGAAWYTGLGTLTVRPTAGAERTYRDAFDPDHYAAFKVDPTQKTIYQFTADSYQGMTPASSELVTVYVQSRVSAKILDRHIIEGQKLAVVGRIKPGKKGVKVTLQHRTNNRWVNVTTARTRSRGRFDLATRAGTPGTWKVRVKVATTQRNVGTWTRTGKVTVDRYVPPRNNQPPPPPEVDSTPETSTQVETPEPTQVTSTAPEPPDRPTPTKIQVAGKTSPVPGATATGRAAKP